MANSPYDDPKNPLKQPEFNRAIKQGREKGLSLYGLDFANFYRRREEAQRKVGWDSPEERTRETPVEAERHPAFFSYETEEILCGFGRSHIYEVFSGHDYAPIYDWDIRQLSSREDLDRFLGDDDGDGFIDEGDNGSNNWNKRILLRKC